MQSQCNCYFRLWDFMKTLCVYGVYVKATLKQSEILSKEASQNATEEVFLCFAGFYGQQMVPTVQQECECVIKRKQPSIV